jgi:hypothetical protein
MLEFVSYDTGPIWGKSSNLLEDLINAGKINRFLIIATYWNRLAETRRYVDKGYRPPQSFPII